MAQGFLQCTVGSGARRAPVCQSAVTVTATAQGAECFGAPLSEPVVRPVLCTTAGKACPNMGTVCAVC